MSFSVRVAMVSALAVVATALPLGGSAAAAPEAGIAPTLDAAALAAVPTSVATLVRRTDTSVWSPPSPDPSDITYIPGKGLLVSDAEVEEPLPPRTVTIFDGSTNMWYASLGGAVIEPGTTLGNPGARYSAEPAGLTYDPVRKVLLVADDNTKKIYTVSAGGDGQLGTGDDMVDSSFYIDVPHITRSSTDPESVAVDTSVTPNVIYVADAMNAEMYKFSLSGQLLTYWDVGGLGPIHPEGLAYDSARDTLLLLDDGTCRVYELSKDMALLNLIDIGKGKCTRAAGITLAPHSGDSKLRSMYIVDRGKDNTLANPDENDGLLEELYVNLPPLVTLTGPTAVPHGTVASLSGTARDDGNIKPMTYSWSKVSGPGTANFTDKSQCTAQFCKNVSFGTPGTYILQLEAFDGENRSSARVTVTSDGPPTAALTVTPTAGDASLPVTADASGSTDNQGIASYTFDFGDGSAKVTQAGPVATHTYTSGGDHTVTVTVTDTAGLSSTAKATVAVNQKPTVSAGPDRSVVMPAAASLAGSASDDGRPNPPGTLTTSWSKLSGPGTVTFAAVGAPSTTATFSAAGTYVLRLAATDSAATATDDVTVTVQAAAPAPPPPPPPVAEPAVPTTTVHAVSPQRILDTRRGLGAKQRKLRPGRALTLQVEGRGGFPSGGVDAAMLNITVLKPKAGGSLTVWPSKLARPGTKSMGFKRGVTKTKLVKTTVGSNGKIRIYNRSSRPIHLLASTNAWWGLTPAGWSGGAGELTRVKSYVRLDTRGSGAALGPRSMRAVKVIAGGALAGIPSDIDAVLLKVVARKPSRSGYLTVFPGDRGRQPWVMSVSFPAGTKAANKVLVPVDSRGRVKLYNRTGRTHVTVKVLGWVSG